MVYALIAANALVFFFTLSVPEQNLPVFFQLYGAVPLRFTDPGWAVQVGYPDSGVLTFFSYMFLHGGWLHFLTNMWSMWIFADNIEDVMGPWKFLAFYLLAGLAALSAHMFFNAASPVPVVGASGAIAGVMGAYFLLYPHSKVLVLIPIFFFPYIVEVPALIFLGIWFLIQFVSGVSSGLSGAGGGIAWWAHAGGFIAGMLLLPLFRDKDRCYYCYKRTEGIVGGKKVLRPKKDEE
jgi:membrane associated rhomboid family serine protease